MLVFSGDVVHGGAAYSETNYRVFWKVAPTARATDIADISQSDNEEFKAEKCVHHKKTVTLMISTLLFVTN